jgi:hypothetical protein
MSQLGRVVLAVAAVALGGGGRAFAQQVSAEELRKMNVELLKQQEKELEARMKQWEKDYPSLVPDVGTPKLKLSDEQRMERLKQLPNVEEVYPHMAGAIKAARLQDKDTVVVKAAKHMLAARLEQCRLLEMRVRLGQFSGSATLVAYVTALGELAEAADLIWDEPKQRLPWYEFRVMVLKDWERAADLRVSGGLETEPEMVPRARAERYKAEIALLKLREKVKK